MNVEQIIITNDSFLMEDGVLFKCTEETGNCILGEKINNKIIITTNFLASPRIAYVNIDGSFHFSCSNVSIKNFIELKKGCIEYQEVTEFPMYRFKERVKEDYTIKGISFIENWSKVTILPDGSFEKEDYPLIPYSIKLKDAYDNLHKLFLKYKRIVNTLIDQHKFIPTITGGLDTRILTCLWRDRVDELDGFYLRDVKQDGKNNVELGHSDLKCATQVANYLGLTNHFNKIPPYIRGISGMFTEGSRELYSMKVNDDRFVYKFIQHHPSLKGFLTPFTDDLFLQIKHPDKNVFRCLMILLVSKDLSNFECTGTKAMFERNGNKPYNFYEEYKDYISQAQEILDYWGEEKCKNFLKEDNDN